MHQFVRDALRDSIHGMSEFTKLEEAALRSIFSETPELAAIFERQLKNARVTKRENTGGGFFTTISVPQTGKT